MNGTAPNPHPTLHTRAATGVALLAAGLLAGAFMFGWADVAPAFAEVPLDVHLAYRIELMKFNGTIMPILMGVTIVTLLWSAVVTRGAARGCAAGSCGLAVAALLTTVFGNVPINGEIKEWAADSPPTDYQERLATWGVFHDIRFAAAVGAFVLLILAVNLMGRGGSARVAARRTASGD